MLKTGKSVSPAAGSRNAGRIRTMRLNQTIVNHFSAAELTELAAGNRLSEALIPSGKLLPEIPAEVVDQVTETQIRQGRDFRVSPFHDRGGSMLVKALNRDGELIAIGEARMPNIYHPMLVI